MVFCTLLSDFCVFQFLYDVLVVGSVDDDVSVGVHVVGGGEAGRVVRQGPGTVKGDAVGMGGELDDGIVRNT